MGTPWAAGVNYEIVVSEAIATVRVWKRPDLSSTQGAAAAREICDHVRKLAQEDGNVIAAVVIDQREAPPLVGKQTRAAIGEMVASCVARHKPIALVNGSGAQQAIMQTIVEAEPLGGAFMDANDAQQWLRARVVPRLSGM